MVLFVILMVVAVLVLLFFLWQVLLNPLIGSPFIFALRLAETLAILGQSAIKWPSQVITGLAPSGLGQNRLEVCFQVVTGSVALLALFCPTLQVKSFFSVLAIVNFNTDMFRLPCLFGTSQPVSKALFTAASPFLASAFGLVLLPIFIKLCSRFNHIPAGPGQPKTLEELCALSNKGSLPHFGPTIAYAVATWNEAILIFFVVSN
jgi:hypothetical protein